MMSQFWLGMDAALAQPGRDWVMSLEEDSVISKDALEFTEEMHSRHGDDRHFRGVNLGSVEVDESLRGTYSLLRYGFAGSAGALPRRSWIWARTFMGRGRRRFEPFDCQVEALLKTGYMATPNLSKTMNFGWIGGTHVTNSPQVRQHFDRMRQSWELSDTSKPYSRRDVPHSWRSDAVPFRARDDFRYAAGLGRHLAAQLVTPRVR